MRTYTKLILGQIITIILLLTSVTGKSQDKGIHFENELTWQQVQQKARTENKYIFIDCYATWCGPCKMMDSLVYTSAMVGNFAKDNFVAIKIQADSTGRDNDVIRQWRPVVNQLLASYKVQAYPTYLFFSPDGNIVQKKGGFFDVDAFLIILKDALDSNKQTYRLLRNYENGRKDYLNMPSLAIKTEYDISDKKKAYQIAKDYYENYFLKLPIDKMLAKKQINFISAFPDMIRANDIYFKLLYNRNLQIDSVMGSQGFARNIINLVISREEIWDKIVVNGSPMVDKPNWKQMNTKISRKFSKAYADRNILDAQIWWYTTKKDWIAAIKYHVQMIDEYGLDTTFWGRFNNSNMIYDLIFKYSSNKTILNKAIGWMNEILIAADYDPADIDTYANLLYKVGRTKEAIIWQERAVKSEKGRKDPEIINHLASMKRNEPTWGSK